METSILPQGFYFFERGWLSSNSLFIHNKNHAVIFDTGYVTHSKLLLTLLKDKLKDQPLDLIVNSHLHSDHCGANALLQAAYPDIDIQIPAAQFGHATLWDGALLTYDITGQSCSRFIPTLQLKDGKSIDTAGYIWQVFAAPGHDNDEYIFLQPEFNILLSADALWENGLGIVFPEFLGGIGFENVSKTLDLIESLKPTLILPGHGSQFSNTSQALSNARRKLEFFSTSPDAHALYSAKVLLKFKLLEVQSMSINELINWSLNICMLEMIHIRFFSATPKKSWIENLLKELVSRGAAAIDAGLIYNR